MPYTAPFRSVAEEQKRSKDDYFRLAIDRAFSVTGSGVVVTGTAFAGQVQVGDELTLSPTGRSVRVRGLHAQNREAQAARAGQRVALRSEEHTSELQSLLRISYAVFCLN